MRLSPFVLFLFIYPIAGCKNNSDAPEARDLTTEVGRAKASPAQQNSEKTRDDLATIKGRITLKGEAPVMPLLQMGSDPACAKSGMRAETILVSEEGGLANVVVRVRPGTLPKEQSSESVLIDQVDCMYRPRVSTALVGQPVRVANSDQTMHNVHAAELEFGRRQATDTIMNQVQPAGNPPIEIKVVDTEVIKLKCDMHGWMSGFVLGSDNSYATVTNAEGRFELQIPPGKQWIEIWHEYYGVQNRVVTLEKGEEFEILQYFKVEYVADE